MKDFQATVAVVILISLHAQDGSAYNCDITNIPQRHRVCVGRIDCKDGIGDISAILKYWDCIRHTRGVSSYSAYSSYYSDSTRVWYDENYDLIVNIVNVTVDPATNTFGRLSDNLQHIKTITVRHGNVVLVPDEVYSMTLVTEVEISNNVIEEIQLDNFYGLTMLNKINVSHNSITVIRLDEETIQNVLPSVVTTVDLSYNLIETLPNNCFDHFMQLKHLILSDNRIGRLDMRTFEGVSRLQSLHLSNNKIIEIGNTFDGLIRLQELLLDDNSLTKLFDYNFVKLPKLVTLNLSSNNIETIENNTFQKLVNLETLDLGYNQIEIISKLSLKQNNNLTRLSLQHNRLKYLEAKSFEDKNITEFYAHGNSLTGAIVKDTFRGIYVRELNLSGGKVTTLSDEAFSVLQFNLLSLNLSSNSISNISKSAFRSLRLLTKLDLSCNSLQYLDFETNDLKNLSIFYARNNSIRSLNKDTFKYLYSLKELDLSFNSITEIESNAFSDLKSLKILNLKRNTLNNVLSAFSFKGLVALERIELTNTRTTSYKDQAFSGMSQLQIVNSSFGQLSDIEYNVFKDTGSLEVIDLSHNLIEKFVINTTTIILIKEIYLNNNLLKNITNDMFIYLNSLRTLNLANNNILNIQSLAFNSLSRLLKLDLSSNSHMQITDNAFDSLNSLSEVSLANVKTSFSFQSSNASIRILDISFCDIEDINKLFIFKVKSLNKLDLSHNKLSVIDKFSFQSMPSLLWLDLSSNMINSIQPGSFLYLNMLNTFNLAANDIPSLQFGVLDGLQNLRELNLSRNAIHSFDAHLLHNTPFVSTLYLDFNDINILPFDDFRYTNITKLSIGGNLVPCEIIAKLKKYNLNKFEITAETLDFDSENVNGVSCRTDFNVNKSIILPVINYTGANMRSEFSSFFKAVETLRVSIENFSTVINNNDDLKADLKNVVKSLGTFVVTSKKSVAEEYNLSVINALLYWIAICITIILIIYSLNFVYTFIKKRRFLHGINLGTNGPSFINSMELE